MKNINPINGWEKEFLEMELREFDSNNIISLITFGFVKKYDAVKLVTIKQDKSKEVFKGMNIPSSMEVVCNIILTPAGFIEL